MIPIVPIDVMIPDFNLLEEAVRELLASGELDIHDLKDVEVSFIELVLEQEKLDRFLEDSDTFTPEVVEEFAKPYRRLFETTISDYLRLEKRIRYLLEKNNRISFAEFRELIFNPYKRNVIMKAYDVINNLEV